MATSLATRLPINPYLGSDALAPFVARVRAGRGLFVLVKTSNPSSGEFQDLEAPHRPLWEAVAERVHGWGSDFIGAEGLTPVGAVVGATYPEHARRARELMPDSIILVPGYGAQGASAEDAIVTARADGLGAIVNASRSLMYAYLKDLRRRPGRLRPPRRVAMRVELNDALQSGGKSSRLISVHLPTLESSLEGGCQGDAVAAVDKTLKSYTPLTRTPHSAFSLDFAFRKMRYRR